MAFPQSLPPPLETDSSLATTRRYAKHGPGLVRLFIGPMPVALVEATLSPRRRLRLRREPTDGSSSDSSDDEHIRNVIQAHALKYYQRHYGGEDQDAWGQDTEESMQKEMRRRWKESEWGQVTRGRRRKAGTQAKRWVGSSFTVGQLPGLDIAESSRSSPALPTLTASASTSGTPVETATTVGASTVDTFVTAPSVLTPDTSTDGLLAGPSAESVPAVAPSTTTTPLANARSSTPTLLRPVISGLRSSLRPQLSESANTAQSESQVATPKQGKGKTVRYAEPDPELEPPAPPREVLARTGSAVAETSAGAVEEAFADNDPKWGEIVMQDRLMVRVSRSKHPVIGGFDVEKSRTARNIQSEGWAEYLVIWRKDRLELYEDYDNPIKGWFTQHKHLAHVISLKRSRTTVSMFCFTDLTFSLTSELTDPDIKAGLLHLDKEGSSIFVLKHRSRTRSIDWFWQLWRALGGSVPSIVEVRCPALDVSLRLDLPAHESWALIYQAFSRQRVLGLCTESLRRIPEWKYLMDSMTHEGEGGMELAWRSQNIIDWINVDDGVDGQPRGWSALWGLALRPQGKAAHLEFRKARHYATHLHLKDDTRLVEPPAVEGYLDRIRANTQTRHAQYITTHDGLLVFAAHAHAYAPAPPGTNHSPTESVSDSTHTPESRRGAEQILAADGVIDMRSVVHVRRAFQLVMAKRDAAPEPVAQGMAYAARFRPPWEEDNANERPVEETPSDNEDEGGEEGLAKHNHSAASKGQLRMRRSFELVLTNGQIIRLEAHSRRVAIEWITRLRELVRYWRRRHHIDAREEMNICETTKARVTPHLHRYSQSDESEPSMPPPDPDASSLALSTLYHWCVLDGCRPIIRSGKLFVRKGLRGQYQHVLLALTAGHLVQFAMKPNSSFWRRRKGGSSINLSHAYVVSGCFAAQALPSDQYDPNKPVLARRYADGLEADDTEEDTLFVLWYRPQPLGEGLKQQDGSVVTSSPALSAKKKTVVFRTRSKLERDTWVWAINMEIERLVRIKRASGVIEVDAKDVPAKIGQR